MRIRAVVDHTKLVALESHEPEDLVLVGQPSFFSHWRWDPDSTTPMTDGAEVIRPANVLAVNPGRWLLANILLKDASVGPSDLTPASGVMRDPGRQFMNVLRLPSVVVDGETITIGEDTYEFDDDEDVVEGNIAVPVEGTLIDQVNAIRDAIQGLEGTELLDATVISQDELIVHFQTPAFPGSALACSDTMGGTNNGWSAPAMYGGAAAAVKKMTAIARNPTATEVALDRMHFLMEFIPSIVHVRMFAVSGVEVAYTGEVSIGGPLGDGNSGKVMLTFNAFDEANTVSIIAVE